MNPLFLLADRIVSSLKKCFSQSRDLIGIYAFNEALIQGQFFKIDFKSITNNIILSLNTHHLEMPWSIEVLISNGNETVSLNSLVSPKVNQEIVYEVNHGLLNDPNGLGNELAEEIANDLVTYLMKPV